jgi:hypothetical protein
VRINGRKNGPLELDKKEEIDAKIINLNYAKSIYKKYKIYTYTIKIHNKCDYFAIVPKEPTCCILCNF